jgi:WavE lipopolysaccharide synthesis
MARVALASTGLVDTRSLEQAAAALLDRSAQLVGWGSGSVFDYFHGQQPVRLDYLVDSDAGRWGETRHGIEIVPPGRLARDHGPSTFVIIYSSYWPEIQDALAAMGDIASLPASAVFADAPARAKLAWAETLAASARRRRLSRTDQAIVVQGPVVPMVTARVLGAMSALHSRDLIVLSTWHDTDPALLAEVGDLVDEIVTSPRPEPAGVQNRNCQIVSTRAGIERAIARGARRVLKTRTDLAVLGRDVFQQARWWCDAVGRRPARLAGLYDRLIVPSSFTRKYLLYHPSDLVMLGDARDMQAYWHAPLDPRDGQLLGPDWIDQPLSLVNMGGHPAESYLGLEFCRAIGRPVDGTLSDSWAFYRDLFAVVDNDWFDLLWFKNLAIPDAALRTGVRQTVSQSFWQRLQTEDASVTEERDEIDPDTIPLRDLAGAPL